jgi:hypothetical protein
LTYHEGELFTGRGDIEVSGESIQYEKGRPIEGTIVKPDGTRIKYKNGEFYNGIDEVDGLELEYRDGRPYLGTLVYPNGVDSLEYINGRPYKGILILENGTKMEYKPGKRPSIKSEYESI